MDGCPFSVAATACQDELMQSDFWVRLTTAFRDAGLPTSQTAIARQLQVGQSAVAKWVHGAGYPTLRKCITAALLTGTNVEWLLTGRGPQKQEGGNVDELTQALLKQWADTPVAIRREMLEYLEFRAAKKAEPKEPQPK